MARTVLVSTDIPGVFRNRSGVLCNERGVALSFQELKKADDARWVDIVGTVPSSPAELMRAIALDPRMHLDTRMHAAKQAAPYYDMRMPLRVEGTVSPKNAIDMAKLAAMSKADRELLLKLLKAAGVEL